MSVAGQMLETYPQSLGGVDQEKLRACIEACFECAQACTACADACLSEDRVAELTKCIRTDLDCADICETTGGCCPGTPVTTLTSPARSWRPAPKPAKCVRTSAPATLTTTSTVGCVPKHAAAARWSAGNCSLPCEPPVTPPLLVRPRRGPGERDVWGGKPQAQPRQRRSGALPGLRNGAVVAVGERSVPWRRAPPAQAIRAPCEVQGAPVPPERAGTGR